MGLPAARLRGLLFLLAVAALMGILSCGGGGAGGSGNAGGLGALTYSTDWGSGRSVVSEQVTLFSASGGLIDQRVLSGGSPATTFPSVPNGTVQLFAQIFSGPNATGTVLGTVDTLVQVQGRQTVNTSVAASISAISVQPQTASIKSGNTIQFHSVAESSGGQLVFTNPSDFVWSSSGAATIDAASGIATGTSAGTATITATHSPSGKAGTANLSVSATPVTRGKWTVMVFLNAANNLEGYALPNVQQMARVATNPDVRFVVQWKESVNGGGAHDFNGTKRFLVGQSSRGTFDLNGSVVQDLPARTDMGLASTLTDFVSWAKTNYPADHYVLVLWDHGNGYRSIRPHAPATRAISQDYETGNEIQVWELATALAPTGHLDIFACDACLMQMVEVNDGLQGIVDFVAGSEDNMPAPGYPYDLVFRNFVSNPDDSPRNLTQGFVTGTIQAYQNQSNYYPVTQSVLDMSQLDGIVSSTNALANALLAEKGQADFTSIVPSARNANQAFDQSQSGAYSFYDLKDIATSLERSSNPSVQAAAQSAVTAVNNAVVWNGTLDSPATGISIDFSKASQFPATTYSMLKFNRDSSWGSFLSVAP